VVVLAPAATEEALLEAKVVVSVFPIATEMADELMEL
jgi:hypothetical protein